MTVSADHVAGHKKARRRQAGFYSAEQPLEISNVVQRVVCEYAIVGSRRSPAVEIGAHGNDVSSETLFFGSL